MTQTLEQHLWDRIQSLGQRDGRSPREVIDEMVRDGLIRRHKQAWRTLEKWCRQGRYEFGTTLDLGWKLPEVAKSVAQDRV